MKENGNRSVIHTMTEFTRSVLQENLAALEKKYAADQAAMGAAVEKGDEYHDNFAYEQATRDRDMTYTQLLQAKERLRDVQIIKPRSETDTIGIGNAMTIRFEGESEDEGFTLLGTEDGNIKDGWLSNTSPLGSALFGKKVGDVIEFVAGEGAQIKHKITVKSIRPGVF